MKLFFSIVALLFAPCMSEEVKQMFSMDQCDRIRWLTPTYKNEREFMMIEVADDSIKKELVEIFRNPEPANNINPLFIDDEAADSGYLIFSSPGGSWAIRIYPHVNDRTTANPCEIIAIGEGVVDLRDRSISVGIRAKRDYRSVIKKIARPANPPAKSIYKIKVSGAEANKKE